MRFQRTELLLGHENMEKLKSSHVLVFGLGGVGGYVVEGLVRANIGEITIVDFDDIDITNINRQIIATTDTIGMKKTDAIEKRAKSINPNIIIHKKNIRFNKEYKEEIFKNNYTYVVDAIDLVTNKMEIIEACNEKKLNLISCMGTGNKLEPQKLEITDIKKTSVCPLAKVIRRECKKRNIKKLKVLYSKEEPCKPNTGKSREKSKKVGSVSFVPSVAGLIIAGEIIKDICEI